jgi:CHAT domain
LDLPRFEILGGCNAVTQEFQISVTPLGNDEYLVRTERVASGVPLAEEQVKWPVEDWLDQARRLMNDPLLEILQGYGVFSPPVDDAAGLGPVASMNLIKLGQQFYNALFQGTLRDSWVSAQGIAQNRGEMLRLRLGLKGLRLPRLPWEVMHESEPIGGVSAVARPLATGRHVLFSRYQPGMGLPITTIPLNMKPGRPLRILMVIAVPEDQQHLNLRQEARQLQQELTGTGEGIPPAPTGFPAIQLRILDQPGREQLTQELEQGNYHVLHYAGHSDLGPSGGNLYLVNRQSGLTEALSGDDLAGLLANNGIRMAVFNSCRGTFNAAADPLSDPEGRNLAEALVSRGIPAVLAMAEKIPDNVAINLTRLFYRNLKQGYPIDLSLSRARQGLISSYGSEQFYWGLPTLYMHPKFDGYLVAADRTVLNPADQLLKLPPASEPLLALPQESPTPVFASVAATDEERDQEIMAQAVMADGDLTDLLSELDDLDYAGQFATDEDLTCEEGSTTVSELLQQLSAAQSYAEAEHSTPTGRYGPTTSTALVLPPRPPVDSATGTPPVDAPRTARRPTTEPPAPPELEEEPEAVVDLYPANRSWGDRRVWLTALGVALGAMSVSLALMASPPLRGQVLGLFGAGTPSAEVNPDLANELRQATPEQAEAIATARFEAAATAAQLGDRSTLQAELAAGQQAVEFLLDQDRVTAAETALQPALEAKLVDSRLSFLRGRLSWQMAQSDDAVSLDAARRYWTVALDDQPDNATYRNALGVAQYATGTAAAQSGQPDQARQAWLETLATMEAKSRPCAENPNSCAISALTLMQLAEQTPSQRDGFITDAIALYRQVMNSNAAEFAPDALAQNWLWSEEAIADWQKLGELAL